MYLCRPYSTVLVHTGDSSDRVQVTIVRYGLWRYFLVPIVYYICSFSSKKSSSKHIEYFYDILTNFDVHGICCRSSEDGYVVVADQKMCGMLMS